MTCNTKSSANTKQTMNCLRNNDKEEKSECIQYRCNFPPNIVAMVELRDLENWLYNKAKRGCFCIFVSYVGLNVKHLKSHISFFHLLQYVVLIEIYEENLPHPVTFLGRGKMFSNTFRYLWGTLSYGRVLRLNLSAHSLVFSS